MDLNEYLVEMEKVKVEMEKVKVEMEKVKVEMEKVKLREIDMQELMRCKEFVGSVGCLIAEGSEFMAREQLYDAIKKEFNRIILKHGEIQ